MITIIIPNYNGEEHLRTCIQSILIQSYKDYKVILVDNGSDDNSAGYVSKVLSDAIIIKMNYNAGFAKAVNEGIKYSLEKLDSEYILLLNNDIELDSKFLECGINVFKNIPDASFAATKMLNYFERDIIDDCGDTIKFKGGSPVARGHGEKDTGQYDKQDYVFGVCAGAGFYKKEIFEKAGLMDEKLIAYYEDFDFSFRAELFGFKAVYEPEAICYHKRGATSSFFHRGYQTEMCERNLVYLRFKNYPIAQYLLYQPLFFFSRARRIIFFWRDYSFSVFYSALKGYLKGIFTVLAYLPERRRIQKSKTAHIEELKKLFVK